MTWMCIYLNCRDQVEGEIKSKKTRLKITNITLSEFFQPQWTYENYYLNFSLKKKKLHEN